MPIHPTQKRWAESARKQHWMTVLASAAKARLHATNQICHEAAVGRITADQAVTKLNALDPPPVAPRRPAPVAAPKPAPVVTVAARALPARRVAPSRLPARQAVAVARLERFVTAAVTKHLAQAAPPPTPAPPVDAAALIEKILTAIIPRIAAAVSAATAAAAPKVPPAKGRVSKTIERDTSGRISRVIEEPLAD